MRSTSCATPWVLASCGSRRWDRLKSAWLRPSRSRKATARRHSSSRLVERSDGRVCARHAVKETTLKHSYSTLAAVALMFALGWGSAALEAAELKIGFIERGRTPPQ